MANSEMTGAEELRAMVNVFNACRESFNDRYSVEELVLLYRALKRSEWDVLPDDWTSKEVADALAGTGKGAEGECVCCTCRDARPREGERDCDVCIRAEHEHETIADDD
jgi:hypothetical protein